MTFTLTIHNTVSLCLSLKSAKSFSETGELQEDDDVESKIGSLAPRAKLTASFGASDDGPSEYERICIQFTSSLTYMFSS